MCGRRRARRLVRSHGLEGRCKKRWRRTTIVDPAAETETLDFLRRHFGLGQVLGAAYVGDITYIATWESRAYLAIVIDLTSRRLVGWALADHMRTVLSDALPPNSSEGGGTPCVSKSFMNARRSRSSM